MTITEHFILRRYNGEIPNIPIEDINTMLASRWNILRPYHIKVKIAACVLTGLVAAIVLYFIHELIYGGLLDSLLPLLACIFMLILSYPMLCALEWLNAPKKYEPVLAYVAEVLGYAVVALIQVNGIYYELTFDVQFKYMAAGDYIEVYITDDNIAYETIKWSGITYTSINITPDKFSPLYRYLKTNYLLPNTNT